MVYLRGLGAPYPPHPPLLGLFAFRGTGPASSSAIPLTEADEYER